MSSTSLRNMTGRWLPAALSVCGLVVACALIAACSNGPQIPAAERPLSKEALSMLGKKGMDADAPMFVRIFKEESELEVWKARDDGRFYHFRTYPICSWSGGLGPKVQQGDKQSPEGFYAVAQGQLKPDSDFYLAFNLGYPNAFDRAHKRTGDFLMVHGKCTSAGCYAMTDALMEEIYALARESFKGGQQSFQVHAFPFRMTEANMARHGKHPWRKFWATLKEGHDHFEATRVPPAVAVCERRYVVNVKLPASRIEPEAACPVFERPQFEPFTPTGRGQQMADERSVAPGVKMRAATQSSAGQGGGGFWSSLTSGRLFGLGLGSLTETGSTGTGKPSN